MLVAARAWHPCITTVQLVSSYFLDTVAAAQMARIATGAVAAGKDVSLCAVLALSCTQQLSYRQKLMPDQYNQASRPVAHCWFMQLADSAFWHAMPAPAF